MINANLEKTGTMQVSGPEDIILFEYVILTRVVHKQLIDDYGKEKGNRLLANLGQIAVKETDGKLATEETYDEVIEVLKNEI